MARKPGRPGRTLIIFFLGVALSYGLVALTASWKPTLGLDLQGGTQITLQANGNPSSESLDEARGIIDQRANASGVAESEVTTQGGDQIVVEIPGDNQRDLVETVKRQAQLRFRLVACSPSVPAACLAGAAAPTDPANPGAPVPPTTQGNGGGNGGNGAGNGGNGGGNGGNGGGANTNRGGADNGGNRNGGGNNRPPVAFADQTPSEDASPSDAPSESPSDSPAGGENAENATFPVDEELAFATNPSPAAVEAYNSYTCREDGVLLDENGEPTALPDDSSTFLVSCSTPEGDPADPETYQPAGKYLLSKAVIQGTQLDSAQAAIPQNSIQWVVQLQMGGDAVDTFATISRQLVGTGRQFAIVLDGQVLSAPTMQGIIPNGEAQISGNFTEQSATSLATSLKYGALPISFGDDPQIINIGPTLAGNQLSAGIFAGLVGLLLVMVYCLFYYRGLGLVIVASLLVAGGVTYSMVLLLSEAAGFTLTLPGIAGLIVAVGITADSFIVFFERIRDEMRDGKSMRVAVESGWVRARNTCLAADTVSLLAAVVLYIFAAGVVKGFAFALGLSTLIDLVVFFWFTKPTVSLLARYRFFNRGHRFSGLSAQTLGVDEITPGRTAPVGGKA